MENMRINLQPIKEYTRSLAGIRDTAAILLELIRVIDSFMEIENAGAFLLEHNSFKLKSKIGQPEKLVNPDLLKSPDSSAGLLKSLGESGDVEELRRTLIRKKFANKNLCIVPLACNQEVLGFSVLEFKKEEKMARDLLTILAGQAFLALKNAIAGEQKEHLDNAALILNSSLDINTAYPMFVSELKKIINFDRITVTIIDLFSKDNLLMYAQFHEDSVPVKEISLPGTAQALVINTGRYVLEEDLAELKLFKEDEFLHTSGIRTALRLPLYSKGKVIGTLNVSSKQPSFYGPREIRLLTDLCHRISTYIENALVYDIVNNKLHNTMNDLQETHAATLQALTVILDRRDAGTKGHSLRVTKYSIILAERIGITGQELENIRLGALLHDIGKIGIPDSILFKPGKLVPKEMDVMRRHPEIGYEMVSKIEFLKDAAPIVLHHHERFDGRGYPHGLRGEDIPVGARIFTIADSFDAMTSDRPYRKALPVEAALAEIKACSGEQFCPECVEMFLKIKPFREA